jgi:hypothetical protein
MCEGNMPSTSLCVLSRCDIRPILTFPHQEEGEQAGRKIYASVLSV